MFNSASIYSVKFLSRLTDDFKAKYGEKFKFNNLKITFSNCPKGGEFGWADCVYLVANYTNESGYAISAFCVYLSKMYGNCGVATVSGLNVCWQLHKNGICKWLLSWINTMLTEMGYTIAIGTTNQDQKAIEPKLLATGWELIESCGFKNRRTHNEIKFWRLKLPENNVKVPVMNHNNPIV